MEPLATGFQAEKMPYCFPYLEVDVTLLEDKITEKTTKSV